jgi:threonine/homoserine/homoserine lactone efflux protein
MLALGAAVAEFFQAWIAVALSDWFVRHLIYDYIFRWIAAVLFLGLALYLIVKEKSAPKASAISGATSWQQFMKGWGISVFNLLAIPYWFTYCGWLRVEGWWQDGTVGIILFCWGVTMGTIAALSLYAWLGTTIVRKANNMTRYMNLLVGLIFLGLGIKLLYGLLK